MKCFRKKTSSETVDERVKHVNGVFSLENTESEYKFYYYLFAKEVLNAVAGIGAFCRYL